MLFEHGHALLIGVGSYLYHPKLNVPATVKDAQALQVALQDPARCGYPPAQVRLLHDATATRQGILAELERLAQHLQPEHTVAIFYCGHGDYGTDGSYCLTTHDTRVSAGKVVAGTGIREAELLDRLRKIKARRKLLLFNACHSGEISPALDLEPEETFGSLGLPTPTAEALLSSGEGCIVITACRPTQKSWVSGERTLFGRAVEDGLSGVGGVANNHGYISAFNLYEHVYQAVSAAAGQSGKVQEPELTVLKGVGPFPVALYPGAGGLGVFDASESLPPGTAAQAVEVEQSRRSFQLIIQNLTIQIPVYDIHPTGNIIFGNQYNLADLSKVEQLLEHIIMLLRLPETSLRVIGKERRPDCIVIVDEQGREMEIPSELGSALGQLQRTAQPLRREEIYLTRFTLDHLYAQWERLYLPLKGILHVEQSLRLTDTSDQAISSAGTKLDDLRQAITEYHKTRLVLLGEPGAGKTTTLDRLALDLARERLREPVKGKIPIRIDLFKYTDLRNPSDFLSTEWQYTGLAETYGEVIARGQVCFLLDGVNQMPLDDRTHRIRKWKHWANSHSDLPEGNWAIFTCRTADYTSSLDLPEVHVQTLDPKRMRHYFELRFGPEQASRYWGQFDQRLKSGDQQFERLARNPFMLSLLADNVSEGQGLSDNRARLMDRLALRLLQHELEEGRQPDSLTADPLGTLNAMLQALSCLAYAMQRNRGEGTLLTLSEAQKVRFGGSHTQPLSIDEALRLGLDAHLLERTKKTKTRKKRDKESETTEPISETESEPAFVFYHHLLQEYFAARRLLDLFRKGKLPTRRLRVAWQRWQFLPKRLAWGEPMDSPPVTGWEETAVMASSLAGKDTSAFVQAVARHNLPVAGRGLAAADPRRQELQAPAETLSQRLLHRQRNLWAHPRARLDAGLALGELGHPDLLPKPFECEEGVVWAIWPPLQSVPSGEFIFGSSPEDRQAAFDEETSQRTQSLPTFQIGRYPATNAEFRYFIQSGGYAQDRWWSPDGQAWKRGGPDAHTGAIEDWLKWQKYYQENDLADIAQRYRWTPQRFRYWQRMVKMTLEEATHQAQRQFERPFDRPAYWDDPELSAPGCPVVGVNWYEAEAYCNWLAHITQQPFALPSEMQWEKAARGTDGRTYPWGERFSAARCNTIEGHYLTTTPVGLYPSGCSPYGLFDCSGNVWEWTTSWYQAYRASSAQSEDFGEKYRVVRGGSWYVNRGVARCACRDRLVPGNFDVNVGFRVLSPG